ncbi:hypothetical protein Tco_0083902 [Tanacetum coccineum]
MSRANPQATIVSEEQLVLRANRYVFKKNNQHVASDSDITDTMLRFVIGFLRHHKLYNPVSLTAIMSPPDPNNTYTKHPSENQILGFIKTLGYDEDPGTKMSVVSKMVATRLHQPWRVILSFLNRSLIGKNSSWDTFRLPILEILWGIAHSANLDFASLIWDEFEWQIVDRSSRPSKISNSELHSAQDDQPITKLSNIIKGDYKFGMEISDTMINDAIKKLAGYNHYIAKKKESAKDKISDELEEQRVSRVKSRRGKRFMCYGDQVVNVPKKDVVPTKTRSLTIAEETFVDTYAEWGQKLKDIDIDAILYSSCSNTTKENDNKPDDADDSDMDSYDDNPNRDDDVNLLNETPANELTDFVSAYEVPLGTHVYVQATNILLQEMFPDENAYYIPSLPTKKIPYTTMTPQPNSLQAKAKKLMQKEKKNMRKINFKKAVTHKFREYDQKLKALTNFNVSEAFEKVVQARVLTEIMKLLRTHILKFVANYVRPRLNNSVLDDSPNNREGENMKKRRKDVSEPSFRSSRQNKSPVVHAQVDTPAIQALDQKDENNENNILGPSIVAIAKKLKELIQKDELTIAYLEGARLERMKQQYKNDVELEYYVDQLKAVVRSDDNEYEFNYADHPRLSLNDVEDMYLLQVQDKLHHLPLEFVKDFNNAHLLFIRRVVIQNRGIDQKIPFIMSGTHKGVVYLNQYNVNSFMKLSEVKKFCDGTLIKIRENLVDMVKKNKMGTRPIFLITKMAAPLPLLEELVHAAESDVTKDRLIVLFEREVVEDTRKVRDFHRLSSELKEAVRRRDGYVVELRASRSYDDALGTIKILSRMQLDDMEKAARLLLMARETQIKVDEKTYFIMRMRDRVVV